MSDKKGNEEKKTPNPTVEQIEKAIYKSLKKDHPDWTEEQIWEEVDNIF